MAAALLSPRRIKGKRRWVRRPTSGRTVYAYVGGNPVSYIDPLGLFEISIEGYCVIGGGAKLVYQNGTLEITGRLGFGLGGGLMIDPSSTPSPHAESRGNGMIARTTVEATAGVGVGPVSRSVSFVGSSGNAFVDYGPQTRYGTPGGYSRISGYGMEADNSPPSRRIGARAGFSVGVEIGSYSNWGKSCGCK